MSANSPRDVVAKADLDLFSGALSPALGRAYARLTTQTLVGCELTGKLIGPSCRYADTLPLTARFIDRGPDGPPLAEAIVPEPSYWTPAMPQLYRAELELRQGDEFLAEYHRMFGFRPLGISGSRLRLDGKNWVVRGVRRQQVTAEDLTELHRDNTCLVIPSPCDDVCSLASELGVLILAELDAPSRDEIRRLARWPAVGIVSLPAGVEPDLAGVGHNLLLTERVDGSGAATVSSWAQIAMVSAPSPRIAEFIATGLPVIAARQSAAGPSTRASADRLQAELSALGLLSGYIG
jgi:hypothetical protein